MKKKTIIISSVVLMFVVIVSVATFVVNKDEIPETNISSTLETHKSTSTSTTTSFESESTTNEMTKFVATTTKKASVTKSESTTKKTSTTKENTTKGNKDVTYNGYKPYEVFVDASKGGNSYYYDENGKLWRAESLTAKPQEPTDECPLCGKENCGAYIKPWHCVVCDKDIAADECHPLSHLKSSL